MTAPSKKGIRNRRRPAAPEVDDALIEILQSVTRHLVGLTATAWARTQASRKLTLPAYRLIVVLSAAGPLPPGALAAELGVTPAAVTQMLQTLIRAGLVTMRQDQSDGRRRIVRITTTGRRIVADVAADRARKLQPILERLTPSEREAALESLQTLDRALRG